VGGQRRWSAAHPVSKALNALVERGALGADPMQARAAKVLDRLAAAVASREAARGFLNALFQKPRPIRGAYLVGAVGRGKTLLMDMFFAQAAIEEKRRMHFHEFMEEVHAAIAKFRKSARAKSDNTDPVAAAVRPILASTRLLCLDEFQVTDITNAMLLGRLFEKLFAGGVVVVATSNVPPDALYENGLNRQLFTPFIALLKQEVEIVPLDGPTDYRRQKFAGQEVYHFGEGPEVAAAMDRLWLRLTGGAAGEPEELHSLGRAIPVPRAAMGAVRFAFAELCERPLGARDYLRLSHAYETFVIDGVPQLSRHRSDAAKRFILLIDTLYDRGVKLAASFAVPLDHLGHDERTQVEFQRTVSRLIEMQSADYLSAPHKAEAAEV
jgi:cell division protein ZapE